MTRRQSLRHPSYRNLLIYHQLVDERRTQTALAPTLGISQRRVSQIGQQVQAWVDSRVLPRHFPGQLDRRFHFAVALERIRLKEAYEPLLGIFTGEDNNPRYLRRYVAVVNGEALNTVEISEKPDYRLLNQAVDVQVRLAELEAIANLGPLADLPNEVHQTVVHRVVPAGRRPAHAESSGDGASSSNPAVAPVDAPSNGDQTPSNTASNGSTDSSNWSQIRPGGVLPGSLESLQMPPRHPLTAADLGENRPSKSF